MASSPSASELKVLTQPSLDIAYPEGKVGGIHCRLVRLEVWALHLVFTGMAGSGLPVFSMAFGWRGAVSFCEFCLTGLPLFWVCLERADFLGLHSLVFSVCWLLQFSVGETYGKKKAQAAHHCVVPWVPKFLISLPSTQHFRLLLLSQLLKIQFYVQNI